MPRWFKCHRGFYLIEDFVGDSATVEASDALLIQILQQDRIRERLTVGHFFEGEAREGHVDLDSVEVHLDDRHEGLVNGAKLGHFWLSSEKVDERTENKIGLNVLEFQ